MSQRQMIIEWIALCCAVGVAQAAEQGLTQNHAEVYECTLKAGHGIEEVIRFGREVYTPWAREEGLVGQTFLWTPVSVAAPYDTADFRWIDYAANWRGYVEGMKAWQRPSAEPLKKQLASLADCRLPVQIRSLAIDSSDDYTSDGLLLLGKCSFKPQVRLSDDQIASHLRVRGWDDLVEEDIFEALWYTTLGIEGESWDFLQITAGSDEAIAQILDEGMVGATPAAQRPFQCEGDLHRWVNLR